MAESDLQSLLNSTLDGFHGSNYYDIDFLDRMERDGGGPSSQSSISRLANAESSIQSALANNHALQTQSQRLLRQLEATKTRATDLEYLSRDLVEEVHNPPDMDIIADGMESPSTPWFKHYHGKEVVASAHEADKLHRFQQAVRPLPWTKDEITSLKRAINEETEKHRFFYAAENAGSQPNWTVTEEADLIDWQKVQTSAELRTHTPIECRFRWLTVESPRLNTGSWPKDEIARLHEIVAQHNEQDWVSIADAVGGGRTPIACLKQYRKKPLEKRDWTGEEDNRLRDAVAQYGTNWQFVARAVGRTSNQCINRWTKTIKPGIRRGRWTEDEDALLRQAIEVCGTVWKKVAVRVRGRTDQQCRERWANVLDPRINKNKVWTAEEDETVMTLAEETGNQWSQISKQMNGSRTDNDIYRRWEFLNRKGGKAPPKGPKRKVAALTKANKSAAQTGPGRKARAKKAVETTPVELEEDQLQTDQAALLAEVDSQIDPALLDDSAIQSLKSPPPDQLEAEAPPKKRQRKATPKEVVDPPSEPDEQIVIPTKPMTTRSDRKSKPVKS